MGERIHVLSKFDPKVGHLHTDKGSVLEMSGNKGAFDAYELLLGALSHCLFATFKSLAEKMQVQYESVVMEIVGVKRDEKVALLETVQLDVGVKSVSDESKFKRAFEIATRYCSVFQTLSKVATLNWTIKFS